MVESPKVRRSSSNGNQRLYNNNMKWVTVRPDISQKRSSNINIYGQNCQIDEDYHFSHRGSLGTSLEDRPPNINYNSTSGGSSIVDLSGFTPNSFEFKYPEIGSSPSCFSTVPVHSSSNHLGNSLKSKLQLDTWKLANPDSTITIKKIKTSPRDKNNETKSVDYESLESDSQKHTIQAALIQPSSSSSSNVPAATITTNANTNTSRARSRQISRAPTYLTNNQITQQQQPTTTTTSTSLSSSFSSASSLISHSQRRSSRANKNPVDSQFVIEKACQHALVLYNFEADIEEELSLVKDTTIIVVDQCADGWWKGRHLDSKRIASFPSNYVKLIPSLIPPTATNSNTNTIAITTTTNGTTEQTTNSKTTRSESISSYFKDDPNIFFPTLGHQSSNNINSSGSFSFRQRSIRKNSLLANNGPTIFYAIKIYVPPFHEHTIIQMNGNENIKDLLEKLGRKKKMLFNEFKCKVRYLNSEIDLPLDTHISLLQDSDKHPLKLFMLGFDYITKFNNTSTRNIQLSNYFNISYSSNNKNNSNNGSGTTITKNWVTFDNQSIQIFNNNTEQQPIRIIGLKYSSIKHSTSSPLSFILKTPFAIIKLTHDHYYNIVNQWVDTIEACSEYNQGNPNIKKKQKKFIIKSSDSFSSSLSLSGHFPPPIDRKQQILEIRDRDINRVCVDCNSVDPEWASISLGCFLCDTCCGIHQRVLVNMSEVLSVILDDQWEDIHINTFDKIGNSVSNEYWEYNLLHKKIKPTSLPGEKELFIISKYKKKEFAPSNMRCPVSLISN